jgi:20S proteasome alpha/beta subunit
MTCIVGVRCSDGVVLAADSVATTGTLGISTIRQATAGKLRIIGGAVIEGTAGPVGLGQKFHGLLEHAWAEKAFVGVKKPHDAMKVVEKVLGSEFRHEAQVAQSLIPLRGPMAAQAVNSATLIALPVNGRAELVQFNENGTTEHATDDLPFVAIGSGQLLADPFLAFIRRIFWPDKPPTVPEGVFAAYWTLHHAIETNPGGVGPPIRVYVLQMNKGTATARELPSEELEEHRQSLQQAEDRLRTFRGAVGGPPTEPVPPKAPEPSQSK